MNRALLLGFVVVAAGCGGKKSFDSLCDNQVPPPEACNVACDPSTAAGDLACPDGYFCAADGKCDAQCSPGGDECGSGNTCSANGKCVEGPGGGGSDFPDADCPAVHFTATKVTPSIQILMDRSGSMDEDFNGKKENQAGFMAPKKFPTERDALVGTQGIVTQLQNSVNFGLSMYPGGSCLENFSTPRKMGNATAISDLISAHPAGGNTPTASAIDAVVADFIANPPPTNSPPVIVLATDGEPNECDAKYKGQDQWKWSVEATKRAYEKGIRLYLLSVGNEITDQFKIPVANAGQGVQAGQPNAKSYTATNAAELTAAFNAIIGGVVSCDLKLNGMVGDASNGIVTLNGMNLTYGTDWTIGADGNTLTLLGNACNTLKSSADPKVDATFSCGAVIY